VLTAYSGSTHPWVAATARAWLTQLDSLVPHVDARTVWNEVPDHAAGFELALRARIVWLSGRMDSWCDLDQLHVVDRVISGEGWPSSSLLLPRSSAVRGGPAEGVRGVVAAVEQQVRPRSARRSRVNPRRSIFPFKLISAAFWAAEILGFPRPIGRADGI